MVKPKGINDLEVWVCGTPQQVAIALHGLASVSTFHYVGDEIKLVGTDKGRVQRYVRAVPAARRAEVPEPPRGRGRKKKAQDFTDTPLIGE